MRKVIEPDGVESAKRVGPLELKLYTRLFLSKWSTMSWSLLFEFSRFCMLFLHGSNAGLDSVRDDSVK